MSGWGYMTHEYKDSESMALIDWLVLFLAVPLLFSLLLPFVCGLCDMITPMSMRAKYKTRASRPEEQIDPSIGTEDRDRLSAGVEMSSTGPRPARRGTSRI